MESTAPANKTPAWKGPLICAGIPAGMILAYLVSRLLTAAGLPVEAIVTVTGWLITPSFILGFLIAMGWLFYRLRDRGMGVPGLCGLIALLAMIIPLAGAGLASLLDCHSMGGSYGSCVRFGIPFGGLLTFMGLMHWLTVPIIAIAILLAAVWAVYRVIRKMLVEYGAVKDA